LFKVLKVTSQLFSRSGKVDPAKGLLKAGSAFESFADLLEASLSSSERLPEFSRRGFCVP